MLVNTIKISNNYNFKERNKNYKKNNSLVEPAQKTKNQNDFSKNRISFGRYTKDFLYEMSLIKHEFNIKSIDPSTVEKYFEALGSNATFQKGSDYAKQIISFCCFNVSEIFKQIKGIIPPKIEIRDFSKLFKNTDIKDAIGVCYSTPDLKNNFQARTILFNSFESTNPTYWENHIENQKICNQHNFLSTHHFLSPFLHEFAHNLHFHKLYKKFGCPAPNQGYIYNPKTEIILKYLNLPIKDKYGNPVKNPCISYEVRKQLNTSSEYGSSLLPETFAEEFTREIVNNLEYFKLRLTRNPFPLAKNNPTLQQILYETWEGLIADGKGLI